MHIFSLCNTKYRTRTNLIPYIQKKGDFWRIEEAGEIEQEIW